MAIGTSDGQYFENIFDYHKRKSDADEMRANEMSGDFESRFNASDRSSMSSGVPPEALRKAGDALVLQGEGYTPEKPSEKGFFGRLSIFNAIKGMGNPENYKGDVDIIKGLVGAVLAPGESYQGKLPMWAVGPDGEVHTSPAVIEKTNELAGLAVLGPMPVAKKLADGTLGSFAGVRSRTIDRNALAEAQIMEANGAHFDTIYEKTGMFRGTEGRWKHEIDDSGARFKEDWNWTAKEYPVYGNKAKVASLPEIYDHPELYKAYPFLKHTDVIFDSSHPSAAMLPGTNSIVLGKSNTIGAVQHEVQHLIQEHEGFAQGGSPGTAGKEYQLKYQKAFDDLNEKVTPIARKFERGEELTVEERLTAERFLKAYEKFPEYVKAGNDQALEHYMNLAGEVEARNVETRGLLTAQERREIPPYATEDNFREHQIVVRQPATTTPYGAWDQQAGRYVKPQAPVKEFRRAANDNQPGAGWDPIKKEYYNPHDHNMIGNKAVDAEMEASWKAMGEKNRRMDSLLQEKSRLYQIRQERPWTDIEAAKFKKLDKEHSRLDPEDYARALKQRKAAEEWLAMENDLSGVLGPPKE